MKATTLNPVKLVRGWNKLYDVSLPQIGAIITDVKGWTKPLTLNDRIFKVLGSYAYRGGMSLLPKDMNRFKQLIIIRKMPMSLKTFGKYLKAAADDGDEEAVKMMLRVLQKTIRVFNYLNDAGLANSFNQARLLLAKEIEYADQYMPKLKGILAIWKEFEPPLVIKFGRPSQTMTLLSS
ncbi:uncharacterized protein P174DRAFT_426141 [Aspergillus novofumigatus IBT 16806]|uniref:Uncharacterized protein n=1 Tax=Aspergillus novofumigatus (strain IBT 16806) TaxID=1392255 RepID=A0A2I1BS72_ASPN1|nr:uncharacterized protein P174DRAFT_426141 [Aspergillus novofumigatus IBT 16806]PKX88257.1 hypothetical protein P174DRAFT_426141 [Aspergillus novofumigatus IBT 16806]